MDGKMEKQRGEDGREDRNDGEERNREIKVDEVRGERKESEEPAGVGGTSKEMGRTRTKMESNNNKISGAKLSKNVEDGQG